MIHHLTRDEGCSIQSLIDKMGDGDVLELGPGCYKEKLEIKTNNITIIGSGSDSTIITFDDYALKLDDDGNKYGTFRSYTMLIQADNVHLKNLTLQNASGDGRNVGQAVALYADGDRLQFEECHFDAYQDTVFTAPLPEKPKIPGSFVGPSQGQTYRTCRQYFNRCTITGDVDYIFGSALALFNQCNLITRNRGLDINGYVAAPSTWAHEPYGYVFVECKFTGEHGIKKESVYFARPWRPYAQVHLIGCTYDESIHPDCFDMWGDEGNRETSTFVISDEMIELDSWHKHMLNI